MRAQLVALTPRLRRFGYALTGSRDDGDDLVQSAYVRALANLERWQPGSRLDSWMFRIMQNLWIDQVRARRVRGTPTGPEALENLAGSDGTTTMEARLMLKRVRHEIAGLPEDQRSVLALVSIDGMSYREAAEALGIPIGTVMSRLARARAKLADTLAAPASPTPGHTGGGQ